MNLKHPFAVAIIAAMTVATPAANAVENSGGDPRSFPIDDTLFVASGSDLRSVSSERLMNATPEEVWAAWTTEIGWKSVYGPERPELHANIELAVGGRYEWLFDGETGSNECQVLSYLPPRMLSFSWNAPTAQPLSREKRTWVVIEIEPSDEHTTLVRTTHLGFGEGPHWDETLTYFDNAWGHVLDQMVSNFANR